MCITLMMMMMMMVSITPERGKGDGSCYCDRPCAGDYALQRASGGGELWIREKMDKILDTWSTTV